MSALGYSTSYLITFNSLSLLHTYTESVIAEKYMNRNEINVRGKSCLLKKR